MSLSNIQGLKRYVAQQLPVARDDIRVVADLFSICNYDHDLIGGLKVSDIVPDRQREQVYGFEAANATKKKVFDEVASQWLGEALKGAVCLDIACNSGFWSFELGKLGARWVLGLDHSPRWIQQALFLKALRDIDNVDFKLASIYDVAFPEDMFDVVLCYGFHYHTRDLYGFCEKLFGMTARYLLMDGWVLEGGDYELRLMRGGKKYLDRDELSFVPSASALMHILEEAGFHTVERWTPPADADLDVMELYAEGAERVLLICEKQQS